MQVVQFHVHYNSEHHLGGASYPLELHIVHSNTNPTAAAAKELAVVGFMFQEGTTTNAFFEPIITALLTLNESNPVNVEIDLSALSGLLSVYKYYNYQGSLTAPNCRETVTWYVMDAVLSIEGDQLDQIRNQFPINNRPIQATNGRVIYTNKEPSWGPYGTCDLTTGLQTRACNDDGTVTCPSTTETQTCDSDSLEEAESTTSDKITVTQALSAATLAIAGLLIIIVFCFASYWCCCRKSDSPKQQQQPAQSSFAPSPASSAPAGVQLTAVAAT